MCAITCWGSKPHRRKRTHHVREVHPGDSGEWSFLRFNGSPRPPNHGIADILDSVRPRARRHKRILQSRHVRIRVNESSAEERIGSAQYG